jgi:AraC-like DNA-binding protein
MNVVALLSDHLLSTLKAVLRDDHRVVAPAPIGDIVHAVHAASADVLVLEPATVPSAQWPSLLEFLRRAGTPTVIVYTTITPPAMRATVELARLGIRHIILKGYDDTPRHLRAMFDALSAEYWSSILAERLADHWHDLPAAIRDAIAFLFRCPDRVHDVADLAQLAGVTPRTLHRWLARVQIASAKRLVLAARVEWAHTLLRTGHLPVSAVATRLGYATSRRFRREVQLLTGAPPAVLGRRLAPHELVELLQARVVSRDDAASA